MKKHLVLLTMVLVSLCSFAQAANRVVVIPLNSTQPVYVSGTEITSLPYTISSSGFYFISQDLTPPDGSNGIIIEVDNVTVDLMGFSLIGPGTGGNHGVTMVGQSNVEIKNGTIRNFSGSGINDSSTTSSLHRIINVRVMGNGYRGINLQGSANLVEGCTVANNTREGILLGHGSTYIGNICSGNGRNGINALSGSLIKNNTCYNNGWDGIYVNPSSTVINNLSYNNGYDGIDVYTGSSLIGNTCTNNGEFGIYIRNGNNLVVNNSAYGNTSGSMYVCPGCTLTLGVNNLP